MSTMPTDWKDPHQVLAWESARATRKKTLHKIWQERFYPLLYGIPQAATLPPDRRLPLSEGWNGEEKAGETLRGRLQRLDCGPEEPATGKYYVPRMVAWDDFQGQPIFSPMAARGTLAKKKKAGLLAMHGLGAKANREIGCGILGGEVVCETGHHFSTGYECGNRYCVTCGPKGARKLFATKYAQLFQVVGKMLDCGSLDCKPCYWFRRRGLDPNAGNQVDEPAGLSTRPKELPHWPPLPGKKGIQIAVLDFTVVNTGIAAPDLVRLMNRHIRRFCRELERLGLVESRQSYGLATCNELGAGNSNIHAHGIYVGPWLPQKTISQIWANVTGYKRRPEGSRYQGGKIIWIKPARDLAAALYHAIKYPAKFAELARPERLAELEVIFHQVRRFHTFAGFYNPKVDKDTPPGRSCPACGGQLKDRGPWMPLDGPVLKHLKSLEGFQLEMNRAKVLQTPAHSPP